MLFKLTCLLNNVEQRQKTLSTPPAPIAHRTALWPRNKLTPSPECLVHPVLSFPTHCTGGALASSKPEQSKPLQVATRRSVSMHTYLVRREKHGFFLRENGPAKWSNITAKWDTLGQLRMMNFEEGTMNFGSIVCHFSPPRPFGFVAHSWTQKHWESGRDGWETSLADQPF